jgi:endonuclease/exonuclease/phosphatase (EEP) superfamily protein YafD
MKLFGKILFALSLAALFATLVSLLRSDEWFIRAIDMGRVLLVYLAVALVVLTLFAKSALRWVSLVMLVLVIGINVWRVWPYWTIAPVDMPLAQAADTEDNCFTAMSINVKMRNEGYARIAEQIRRHDPDVLLLMETNATWLSELRPILANYPEVLEYPKDNTYGLGFASRLPVTQSRVVENTSRDTPTLYATLEPEGGPAFEFIGLHPRPPVPGQDTGKRDENILKAGIETPDRLSNALVMGDFNDVPWSRTTDAFRRGGGWDDPRIGRGSFATFPADYVPLGWPLDQVMVKGDLGVRSFEVLEHAGSDHLGLIAQICMSDVPPSPISPR